MRIINVCYCLAKTGREYCTAGLGPIEAIFSNLSYCLLCHSASNLVRIENNHLERMTNTLLTNDGGYILSMKRDCIEVFTNHGGSTPATRFN